MALATKTPCATAPIARRTRAGCEERSDQGKGLYLEDCHCRLEARTGDQVDEEARSERGTERQPDAEDQCHLEEALDRVAQAHAVV